jgi:hypothetical protein
MEEKQEHSKSENSKPDASIRSDLGKKTPSPYDLHSNDNPGSVITQVQLRGENYDEWA